MKKSKSFTLIELLVVLAIIGILSTLVVVSYNGVTKKSKIAKAKADIANIASAFEMYKADNKELPFGYSSDCRVTPGISNQAYGGGNLEWKLSYDRDVVSPILNVMSIGNGGLTYANLPHTSDKWAGPYIDQIPAKDPWGIPYRFDPDYLCYKSGSGENADQACSGFTTAEGDPNRVTVMAIASIGPDKVSGVYGGDNISILVCKRTD